MIANRTLPETDDSPSNATRLEPGQYFLLAPNRPRHQPILTMAANFLGSPWRLADPDQFFRVFPKPCGPTFAIATFVLPPEDSSGEESREVVVRKMRTILAYFDRRAFVVAVGADDADLRRLVAELPGRRPDALVPLRPTGNATFSGLYLRALADAREAAMDILEG